MHALDVVAFIIFVVAAAIAGLYEKAYVLALIAAGLAVWVAPAAFHLH